MSPRVATEGPKGVPILGVLPAMKAHTLKFLKHAATFGDFVPLRILMTTAYLLNHPTHVEHVLQKNHRNYRKTPMLGKLRPVLGDGLFMSEGELWTRQRKLIQPSFHKERVDALASIMTDVITTHLKAWETRAQTGETFNLTEDIAVLTLEIALQTMFGTGLGKDAEHFGEAMKVVHHVPAKRIWDFTGIGEKLPTRENREFNEAVGFLRGVVARIINERRAHPRQGNDLLSILMEARDADTNEAMDDIQLRDEVMTLMLAGHDTTATMVAWALLMLSQEPTHLEAVRNETDQVLMGRVPGADDLKAQEYMKRVIQEVARLRPSIWWFARVAINDDNIAGQPIKAGTTVFISQYLIHTQPTIWEDPEKFDPDRFLPDRTFTRSKFAYFPFGAGPRVCIGSSFAMMEMQFALAMILRRFDITITSDKDPEFGNLITLRPTHDIWAQVKLRRRH